MKMIIGIEQNFKLRHTTSQRVVKFASSSTQSALNARPIGLYLTHPWAPGRGIGVEGERKKGVERRWRGPRGYRSKVSKTSPPTLYKLTASSLPPRLPQQGAL